MVDHPIVEIKLSYLRKVDLAEFPNVTLFGLFDMKGSVVERSARVGAYLRKLNESLRPIGGKIHLIEDDDRPYSSGWKYVAHKVIRPPNVKEF